MAVKHLKMNFQDERDREAFLSSKITLKTERTLMENEDLRGLVMKLERKLKFSNMRGERQIKDYKKRYKALNRIYIGKCLMASSLKYQLSAKMSEIQKI